MKGYIRLLRPVNAIMASLGTVIGGIVALESVKALLNYKLYIAMLAVFFILMAGNIINDYFDLEIDRINHPNRPLPSGEISKGTARNIAIIFFTIGIILSFLLYNIIQVVIVILAIALLISYEWKAKASGLIGNIIISFLVGLVFIFGSLSIRFSYIVVILALMAILANLAREIVKDVEDVKGDINRKTLPKKIGTKLSIISAAFFIFIAISLSPVPYLYFGWKGWYVGVVAIADLFFIFAAFYSFTDQSKGQSFIKLAMIMGLIAFLVGGIL
jgi:geranylgeranylglycerol-phosphate geranylgeranyltransferase